MSSYSEQMERLKRAYGRLVHIDRGKKNDMNPEYYRDDLFAFFLNCHHLKDWLKNDSSFRVDGSVVENYIDQNNDLRICADICNGHKHFVRDKFQRSTESPVVEGQNVYMKIGTGTSEISIKFTINTESGMRDGFELATNCLQLWESFIKQNT